MSMWQAILDAFRRAQPVASVPDVEVIDIRKIASPWKLDRKTGKRWSVDGGRRSKGQPTGICLHQTACLLGESPERWATVGAHYGVMRSGRIVQIYDDAKLIWHGNEWSAGTIGIEIDGLLAGIVGDLSTVWDDPSTKAREMPMPLTDAQVTSTSALIRMLAERHPQITKLVAHRQSSETRRSDPGQEVWKRIALPMSKELGLDDGGDGFRLGDGRAVPREWDPKRTGRY